MTDPTGAAADGGTGGSLSEAFGPPFGAGRAADGPSITEGHEGPVVRDRRKIDPQTGRVREAYLSEHQGAAAPDGDAAATAPVGDALAAAQAVAQERLADLQRVTAEFTNYRRRVERDRDLARDQAVAGVFEALLPVLDDVHLARQHGDLEGTPFAAIADKLDATLARLGLARYGEPGEAFDPTVHEALIHTEAELAAGTTTTTVVQILQPGYRARDKVLRAARVAVADPA